MSFRNGLMALLIVAISAGGWFYYRDYQYRRSEEALLERAKIYWEAVRLNDMQTAYRMEAETAAGNLLPHEVEHRHDFGMRVVRYTLGKVNMIGGDAAEIGITTEVTMNEFGGHTIPGSDRQDQWTFIDGQWHHGTPEAGGAGVRKPQIGLGGDGVLPTPRI